MTKVKREKMSSTHIVCRHDTKHGKFLILLYKSGKVVDWRAAYTKQLARKIAQKLAETSNATLKEFK